METWRHGDKEMRLDHESPCLPLSLSPCLLLDLSVFDQLSGEQCNYSPEAR